MARGRKKILTPALEDYLTIIYEIQQKQPAARISTIARKVGVSLPSVTNAVRRLADLGYVEYEKYGLIILTNKGKRKAQIMRVLQQRICNFFYYVLGVPVDVSDKISKHLSHYLTARARERVKEFYRLILDFDETKAKDLRKFIEESRKLVNVEQLPQEVLEDIKAAEIEEEEGD
ncbi:MAG TPA: metal-dependent transcriptional regulator [Pseudothermotoga sp.]